VKRLKIPKKGTRKKKKVKKTPFAVKKKKVQKPIKMGGIKV